MTSFLQVKINNIDLKKIELILMFKLAVLLL